MANIGSFAKTANGFTGTIRTLPLGVMSPTSTRPPRPPPTTGCSPGPSSSAAGWKRTAEGGEQRDYVSLKLDDPSVYSLIRSR